MTNEVSINAQQIADTVKAATVAVALYHPDMPETKGRPFTILGSGFCIHPEGVIVTCKHVLDGFIDPAKRQPHVIFYHPKIPGHSQLHVNIVPVRASISDVKNLTTGEMFDIAVLRIAPPSEGYKGAYPILSIANYEDIHEMMDAVTCGFPFGDYLQKELGTLTSSFSKGIVSSIIPWPGVTRDDLSGFQLDVRAADGNSGGPVFSLTSGQVFGVLRKGVAERGLQLLIKAEPIYPVFTHGLVEQILQVNSPTSLPQAI